MADQYDLIIVGGGPIGLACAIEAQKKNLKGDDSLTAHGRNKLYLLLKVNGRN